MVRIAKASDPKRIAELKKKINDSSYLRDAIRKIAQQLSDELIQHSNKPVDP
jgi:anti-sigma28 factor (negative regulator of flagellin synthesis)